MPFEPGSNKFPRFVDSATTYATGRWEYHPGLHAEWDPKRAAKRAGISGLVRCCSLAHPADVGLHAGQETLKAGVVAEALREELLARPFGVVGGLIRF